MVRTQLRTRVANTLLLDNALRHDGRRIALGGWRPPCSIPSAASWPFCGDGGFMMNSQEMETAVRLKLNLVILVLEDGAYGMIRWKQAVDRFPEFRHDFSTIRIS